MDRRQLEIHADLEDRHWWFVARRRILFRLLARALPPGPRPCVVDLGCATGGNVAAAADAYDAVGIDTSGAAIELARGRFPRLAFVHAERPERSPQLLGADAVLITDVLEHVGEDREFLREVIGSLEPGAIVLLTVPARPDLWSPHDVALGHHRRYTPDSLRALWENLPVRVALFSFFNRRLFALAWLERKWRAFAARRKPTACCDVHMPGGMLNAGFRRIFSGEGRRLERVMDGRATPYATGLSLIAMLVREENGRNA